MIHRELPGKVNKWALAKVLVAPKSTAEIACWGKKREIGQNIQDFFAAAERSLTYC